MVKEPVMERQHTVVLKWDAGLTMRKFDEDRWDLAFGEVLISLSDDLVCEIVGAYLEQEGMDQAMELVDASWALREDREQANEGSSGRSTALGPG